MMATEKRMNRAVWPAPAEVSDKAYAIAVLREEVRRLARTGDRLAKQGQKEKAREAYDRHDRLLRYVTDLEP